MHQYIYIYIHTYIYIHSVLNYINYIIYIILHFHTHTYIYIISHPIPLINVRNRTTSTQMCQACSLACHSFTWGNLLKTYIYISHRSMYGIYSNIWGILMVNVTIYGIHGSYGVYIYIYWKPMDIPPMCLKWSCSRFDRVKHLLPSQLGDEKLLGLNRRWRFYATSLETCDLDPRCWLAMAIDGEMVEINGKIHVEPWENNWTTIWNHRDARKMHQLPCFLTLSWTQGESYASSGQTHGKTDGSGGVSDLCSESSYGFCCLLKAF